MRQTLFRIPLDQPWHLGPLGEVPGFGLGVVLLAWVLLAAWWLFYHRGRLGLRAEVIVPAVVWLALAAIIVQLPAWTQRGKDAAIAHLTQVIEHRPAEVRAYVERGNLWESKREYGRAIEDFETAVRLDPDSAAAHRSLAWVLATAADTPFRDGTRAVEHAERAAELTRQREARTLDALAAAHAEAGRFDEAVLWGQEAARRAASTAGGEDGLRLPDIRKRLESYLNEQPWRQNPREQGTSIPVFGYGFMLFLGFFAAGWSAVRRARMVGIGSEVIWDLALWVFFLGIAGARLFYVAQYPGRVFGGKEGFDRVLALFMLPDGGLVLYGGILAGIAAYITFCYRRKLNALLLADVIMPSAFIGLAFGRMGCFLNGCCYGGRCELPWAVSFPFGSVPDMALLSRGWLLPDDLFTLALHPTQIYSTLNALVLAGLTHAYFRYRHRNGAVLAVGWLSYPLTRFLIEYIRSDEPPVVFTMLPRLFTGDELARWTTPFTISQWVSLALFAAGVAYAIWLAKRPVGRISNPSAQTP